MMMMMIICLQEKQKNQEKTNNYTKIFSIYIYFIMYIQYMKNKRTYKNRRKKIKGGVFKIDDNITAWDAINKMMDVEGAKLQDISYSSLSGFIFKLDIPHHNTPEFITSNEITHGKLIYNTPVYSLILKLAIIGDSGEKRIFSKYTNINNHIFDKQSEFSKDYENEYNVQNSIYFNTLYPNGTNICPGVIDIKILKFFERNGYIDIKNFLDKLKKITVEGNKGDECRKMIDYFKNVKFRKDISLGIITMEFVDDQKYKLLKELRNEVTKMNKDVSIYENVCLYALAELIVLFIKLKIINYDCHAGNIFGNISQGRPLLIDFGRTANLLKLLEENNSSFIEKYNDFFTYTNNSSNSNNDESDADSETLIDEFPLDGGNFDKYRADFDNIKDIQVSDFYDIHENKEELKQKIENIIQFIACVDYTKNCINVQHILERPQMFILLNALYHTKSDWYQYPSDWKKYNDNKKRQYIIDNLKLDKKIDKNSFKILDFDWKMDENKFEFICEKIKELTYDTNNIFRKTIRPITQEQSISPVTKRRLFVVDSTDFTKKQKRSRSPSSQNKTRKKKSKNEND